MMHFLSRHKHCDALSYSMAWMFGVYDRRKLTLLRYITVRPFKKISKHFNRISTLRCRPGPNTTFWNSLSLHAKLALASSTPYSIRSYIELCNFSLIFTRPLAHRKSWGIFTKITQWFSCRGVGGLNRPTVFSTPSFFYEICLGVDSNHPSSLTQAIRSKRDSITE